MSGGMAAFLHDMLLHPADGPPRLPNSALAKRYSFDQKLRTMPPEQRWWYERLVSGTITRKRSEWPAEVARADVYDDYLASMEQVGIPRRAAESVLGATLSSMCPGVTTVRRRLNLSDERVRNYRMPDLQECRASFAAFVRWPDLFALEQDDDDL